MDALMNHHDPTRTSLVDGVHGVTGALLLDKKSLRLGNPADEPFEFTISIERCEKAHVIDASDVALYLADRGPKERCAERDLNAGSALVTDRSNFARTAVEHHRDDRENRIDREINKRVGAVRLLGNIPRREMNNPNMFNDFREIAGRQRVKDAIPPRIVIFRCLASATARTDRMMIFW
jgi:hypothetical protein